MARWSSLFSTFIFRAASSCRGRPSVGITREPAFDMTTTEEPHYFVLSKRSSSYIFHRSYPIRDVETIPGTVQQLITRRLKWDLDTDIEIRYYLVPFVSNSHLLSGLPLTFSQPGEFHNGWTKSRIEQTVNDDYLESHCREIDLSDLGGGTQQNVIVVAIGRSTPTLMLAVNVDNSLTGAIIRVSFHVFVRTGPGEPITYAGYGDVRGDLGSIMDLAKEKAEEIAGRVEGMNTSPGACVTRVSKVQPPNNFLWCMSLTATAESIVHRGASAEPCIHGGNVVGVHCSSV